MLAGQPNAMGRRQMLEVIGAGSAAVVLAGCTSVTDAPTTGGASRSAGTLLAKTSAVPVGGGTILTSLKVVVTQPQPGEFHALGVAQIGHARRGHVRC